MVEIIDAVNMMYTSTTAQVLSPGREFFEILAGVLQAHTLAQYLLIIALDYAMRQAIRDESNLALTQ